ncbi:MAG TPA: carbohydrate ABC transporter permease [Thermomicrobiales bacterium]|jgi:glucose/mannose transport system permease protein|nr:carbohydrate ABC transporter permease [Thermomicrobiales bacterium]
MAADLSGIHAAHPRQKRSFGNIVVFVVLVLAALFYVAPVYVMIINGLKDKSYMTLSDMWKLPRDLSGGGFGYAWDALRPYMLNSLQMAIPATIGSSLLGAINGYLLSKWKFRGSDILFSLVLFGMFIPYQSILVPLIETLQRFGLYGKWYGLTFVHIIYGIPITTLIFRNYFSNIPSELIEAARIDGAGLIKIFWQIMLPLGLPAFVVVGIFQFTNIWNDFLFGVTVVFSPSAQPVTVALNNLQGTQSVDWTVVMAGAAIAAAPTMIIYVLLGKFFIRGLLAGSMKG